MGVLVVATGYKQALSEAVAAVRAQELQTRIEEDQLELFGAPSQSMQETHVPIANGHGTHSRIGRPQGARNKRTDEAARLYMQRFGDPLARAIEIAAIPILADGVLAAFANRSAHLRGSRRSRPGRASMPQRCRSATSAWKP
jgi:hypothetical protein